MKEGVRWDAVVATRIAVAQETTVQVRLRVDVVHADFEPQVVNEVVPVSLEILPHRPLHESGENPREVQDAVHAVGGNVLTARVALHRTVRVQLVESNGEELHDLPCEVLVREPLVVVVRRATGVREVLAHERAEGHLPEDLAEVPKGMADENVKKVQPVLREVVFPNACADHENLREAPGHPLTELVLGAHHLREPDARLRVVVVDSVVVLVVHEPV
mmetsp:Transcript_73409/g.208000  ORF Transcript_73409/g.208000 Transcript_73409/m.208000 type:complete len:218 (+) Transcript_73409:1426-2079(+)